MYSFPENNIRLRTALRMGKQAERIMTEGKKTLKGVKGKSIISTLPLLDISTCVLPEYMHSVLLGVGKQFIHIWYDKVGPWNIKKCEKEVDNILLGICAPHSFHRMPRSISLYHFYKAYEILNWIIYYSIPSLIDILPEKYFQHWILLVMGLYTLLQENITVDHELEQSNLCLRLFVREVADLYGDREQSYNIHQLLHLSLCVQRWGPLWATSAFSFEHFNGYLAKCVHGTKHMGEEIIKYLTLSQGARILKNQCDEMEMNNDITNNVKKKFQLLGSAQDKKTINELELNMLATLNSCVNDTPIYARAKIKNEYYNSKMYKLTKNDSSNVQLKFKNKKIEYGSIRFFFESSNNLYFSFQLFSVIHAEMFFHHKTAMQVNHIIPVIEKSEYIIINFNDIEKIRTLIRVGNFVCKPPNNLRQIF